MKNAQIEIMLQYLKPNERKVLYCMLSEAMGAENFEKYDNLEEVFDYLKTNYEEIFSAFDNKCYIDGIGKCKILNPNFIREYPSDIYLDLKDKFQSCIFTYSKILNKAIYLCFADIDFSEIKDIYYAYEKIISEKLYDNLEPSNLYFNLIFLQGILSEIKDGSLQLKGADTIIISSILTEKIYNMMSLLIREKEGFIHDRIADAYAELALGDAFEIEKKKGKIIEKMKEEGIKLKEKINMYEEKIKFYQKNNNDVLINNLYEDIRKKDLEINDIKNELIRKGEAEAKKIDVLNEKIHSVYSEKEKLLLKNKELEAENKELSTRVKEWNEENVFLFIKQYIDENGPDKILSLIPSKEIAEEEVEKVDEKPPLPIINNKIGYISLTEGGIEVVTPMGIYPVNNIPERSLVGEGQFVRIDSKNNYINSYRYYTQQKVILNLDNRFGAVKHIDGKIFVDIGSNNMRPVLGITNTIQEGQIVLVDSEGKVKLFFKKMHFILDSFYEIIKFRGMSLWRIMSMINNTCIIENIESKKQELLNIPEGNTVKTNDILLMKDKLLMNIFDFKFYSRSCYYDKAIEGTAEIKDGVVLLVKGTGEKVIVNDLNGYANISEGDTIVVDEYNNFIRYEKNTLIEVQDTPKRKTIVHTNNKFKISALNADKQVLIIGNPAYQQSYKLSLLRNGYKAEVIDGYSPWSKVQKMIKDVDMVVIIVNYVSHENMWLIKENVKDIPVIYPDSDGAKRIIDEIEDYYSGVALDG